MRAVLAALFLLAPDPGIDPAGEVRAVRWRLVDWRDAWERRDVEAFLACIHPAFRSSGLDRAALAAQKRAAFARSAWVRVGMSDIAIEVAGDTARVRFLQEYASDRLTDRGWKTLELSKDRGQWLIIAESFTPAP